MKKLTTIRQQACQSFRSKRTNALAQKNYEVFETKYELIVNFFFFALYTTWG